MDRRTLLMQTMSFAAASILPKPPFSSPRIEVIASTLEEAQIAKSAGASRIELAVDLQDGGFTPPMDITRQVAATVPIPARIMLRSNTGFDIHSEAALADLVKDMRSLSGLPIDGVVLGFLKDGMPDVETLKVLLEAAPQVKVTFHNALERSTDVMAAIEILKNFPQIDILLVHGQGDTLRKRADALRAYANHWQNGQRRLLVNGLSFAQIAEFREMCPFIREFHLGSQVRTPELPYPAGKLDPAKLQTAHYLFET
jgi:copper homeostasis protein